MDAFAKSEMFFSTPIQTLYYLQLWAPFLRPEGVCSRELPLYKYMPLDGWLINLKVTSFIVTVLFGVMNFLIEEKRMQCER